MSKKKSKNTKRPHSKNNPHQDRSQIKTGYRIGALVLVITIIASMLAVYVL